MGGEGSRENLRQRFLDTLRCRDIGLYGAAVIWIIKKGKYIFCWSVTSRGDDWEVMSSSIRITCIWTWKEMFTKGNRWVAAAHCNNRHASVGAMAKSIINPNGERVWGWRRPHRHLEPWGCCRYMDVKRIEGNQKQAPETNLRLETEQGYGQFKNDGG